MDLRELAKINDLTHRSTVRQEAKEIRNKQIELLFEALISMWQSGFDKEVRCICAAMDFQMQVDPVEGAKDGTEERLMLVADFLGKRKVWTQTRCYGMKCVGKEFMRGERDIQ